MYTNNNETDNIKRIFIKDVSNQNNIADELTKIDIINERDEKDEKKIIITELTNGSKQIKKKEKDYYRKKEHT